jgi:predicted nucleotidyltransferase
VQQSKNWQTTRLRPPTRKVAERIAQGNHNPKIRYIFLFGSEARGEATLTSDVDIALVSDEPLTRDERLAFASITDDVDYPEFNIVNTLTADLDTDEFMDVNYHIKREGLLVYER